MLTLNPHFRQLCVEVHESNYSEIQNNFTAHLPGENASARTHSSRPKTAWSKLKFIKCISSNFRIVLMDYQQPLLI